VPSIGYHPEEIGWRWMKHSRKLRRLSIYEAFSPIRKTRMRNAANKKNSRKR
jgi:hypothetical protein